MPFIALLIRYVRPSSNDIDHQYTYLESQTENEYCLLHEYGFPVKDIPLTSTNTLKLKQWNQWLKMRSAVDEYHRHHHHLHDSENSGPPHRHLPLECPDHRTIVFKTGGGMWDHPPNKAFRSILSAKEADRDAAVTFAQKGKVVSDILQETRDLGFDFWRWDKETGWYIRFDLGGIDGVQEEALLRNSVYVALKDHLKRVKARRVSQARREETSAKKRRHQLTSEIGTLARPDRTSTVTNNMVLTADQHDPSMLSSSLLSSSYSAGSDQECSLFGKKLRATTH
jgi:hypothetical protein